MTNLYHNMLDKLRAPGELRLSQNIGPPLRMAVPRSYQRPQVDGMSLRSLSNPLLLNLVRSVL